MYIEKLKIKNYRNYEEVEVNFNPFINIIYGDNAAGKTNLLESIYICSTSKSHKNAKENDLINFNKDESHIKLLFNKKEKKTEIIDIQLNRNIKKGVAINGIKKEKISDFIGFLSVVMFAPEDLNIIKEGPQVRRKFIDLEISQIDKIYVSNLKNYYKLLNQRNSILKDISKENGSNKNYLIDMLKVYDEKLIEYGLSIIKKRKENIKNLALKILEKHLLISDNKEELIIDYENDVLSELLINNEEKNRIIEINTNENIVREIYKNKLLENYEIDIKNQYTLIGPHRDDISFIIKNKDIRKYGSQGQKKTAAICLKLSELDIIKEKNNETPVLLLDDVFSELDEKRQKLLVSNIKNVQVIITCTGIKKNIFDILKPDKILNVKDNKVIEKNLN